MLQDAPQYMPILDKGDKVAKFKISVLNTVGKPTKRRLLCCPVHSIATNLCIDPEKPISISN